MVGTTRLVCPQCHGELRQAERQWTCVDCAATYRVLRGIPDLRTADDVYLSNRADWEFALRLDEDFDRLDFRGLLERYYDLSPEIPTDLRRRQIAHILTGPDRFTRLLERSAWIRCLASWHDLLELGCGTGSVLLALASRAPIVAGSPNPPLWGLDIAMRWLLLARKRLDEAGYCDVRLVCGCAERLPFAGDSFGGVVGGDVIEHVADQMATLSELYRVLEPLGRLYLATPNRYSLAPEPHVQVWGVGFLPRAWMAPYVRLVRGVDFRAIRTLHWGEWKALLKQSPFREGKVFAGRLDEDELRGFPPLKRFLGRLYNRRLMGPAALAFGPMFHIECAREVAYPRPSPTTRLHSRPTARQA